MSKVTMICRISEEGKKRKYFSYGYNCEEEVRVEERLCFDCDWSQI